MADDRPNQPKHSFEEHTGEVLLRVLAPTLPLLFEEAARALGELLSERLVETKDEAPEQVLIRSTDREALLVDWLNELIFRGETGGKIYDQTRIKRLTETELEAEIRGTAPDTLRTAVKAATFHQLQIAAEGDGYSATVVLDV